MTKTEFFAVRYSLVIAPSQMHATQLLTLSPVSDQQKMTRMTVDSLGQQSTNAALAKLDSENGSGRRAGSYLENDSFQGPFGVFKIHPSEASRDGQAESQPDLDEPSHLEFDLLWRSLDTTSAVAGDTDLYSGLNIAQGSEGASTSDPLLEVDTMQNNLQICFPELLEENHGLIRQPMSLPPTPVRSFALSGSTLIPPRAPELLRFFKENVVSLSFPLKNCQKCPWQTIHFPSAMSTFAELSIYETASYTRLSLFYSLLAASCLHKYTRDQSAAELNMSGKGFVQIAKRHLELALNEEVLGPKRAKYKDILMAVLSVVMLLVRSPIIKLPVVCDALIQKLRYSTAKTPMLKLSWSMQSISSAYGDSPNPINQSRSAHCIMSTHICASWPKALADALSLIFVPIAQVLAYYLSSRLRCLYEASAWRTTA